MLDASIFAHMRNLKTFWFHKNSCIGYCDSDEEAASVEVVTIQKIECDKDKLIDALSSSAKHQQTRIESLLDRFEAGMNKSLVFQGDQQSLFEKSRE